MLEGVVCVFVYTSVLVCVWEGGILHWLYTLQAWSGVATTMAKALWLYLA